MSSFLCTIWPYLAGGLIGWLLAGWFARRLKHTKTVEKLVEKRVNVDNPDHLKRISLLEKENSQIASLRSQVSSFKKDAVGSADHLKRIALLEGENKTLLSRIKGFETAKPKMTDNPEHLKRIAILEEENKKLSALLGRSKQYEIANADLQKRLKELERSEPNLVQKTINVEKVKDNPEHLERIATLEKENQKLNTRIKGFEIKKPKTVDNPDHLKHISLLETENKNYKTQLTALKQGKTIDLKAARAAGINISSEDDFTAIEGIGPKINGLIHADGINTFGVLSETSPKHIQTILDNAGPRYQMANPGTWPDQANLAANNRWGALKALQDILDGGVYPDTSSSKSGAGSSNNNSSNDQSKKIADLEKQLKAYQNAEKENKKPVKTEIDTSAAKASGFKIKASAGQHDFTVVEGIGPKINGLIHDAGIHLYGELAKTEVSAIQKILDDAGPRYKLARPGTWPAQASMADKNEWAALRKWQDELDGGKE